MRKTSKRSGITKRLTNQIRTHKKAFMLYVVLRVLVISVMILQILNRNYENVFLCVLTLVLFFLPSFVELNFHIELPDTLEIVVLLFIFAAEILGEISSFYTMFPFWDSMLHTANGFLAAAIGYSMVDLLNRNERIAFSLSPVFLSMTAFCFSMTIGVLWEFYECASDLLLGTDMQKDFIVTQINSVMFNPNGLNEIVHKPIESVVVNGEDWMNLYGGYIDIGLLDTMKDLFVNFIGAVVFSVIGYFHAKSRGSIDFAKRFILRVKPDVTPASLPEGVSELLEDVQDDKNNNT